MKKLNIIILILMFSLINILNVYPATPTEYDEEQDIVIEDNIDNITDNADNIADISDNVTDTAENIATNTSNISSNDTDITNNSQRLNDHEGRIDDLEETQFNVVGEVQFIRAKNHTVSVYTKYDVRHSRFPEIGLKITIGLGKSWTEREIDKINAKLEELGL